VVKSCGGGLALRGYSLNDPGVVDVDNPIGNLRTRLVEGDEVAGDRERGGEEGCAVCYEEMLMGCVIRE
jgi:hypothetical protein